MYVLAINTACNWSQIIVALYRPLGNLTNKPAKGISAVDKNKLSAAKKVRVSRLAFTGAGDENYTAHQSVH